MTEIDISKFVTEEAIVPDLRARTKEEAIAELLDRLFQLKSASGAPLNQQDVLKEVLAREEILSTGVGDHVAFPHARIKGWKEFSLVFGLSRQGIDFASPDQKAVHFICLMISPGDEPYTILRTMAAVARCASSHKDIRSFALTATPQQIVRELTTKCFEIRHVILAKDIMRPAKVVARLDSRVEDVARQMHLSQQDVLPILDHDGRFCGEISCFHIFDYSIPDFFHQLNTVSFIKNFDPFEKYFKVSSDLAVKDIPTNPGTTIPEDATLVEIVFQLAVKNKLRLFVVKDGRLIGEIDRFSIIDKILFF
ncbi:MAG TPA: PTS sugar transporter subunit IIA [Candidatus Omnitrophota bacterium]|jgi:mannitol/fructose-specific phosphotransferase system IIA component (Ntr-type)|nr:PTS sugar transporter subunit IIA [Candidatus Omnitrophota bacterium]HSA31493.1 PTS sugar transporter subunit IIA [Candidatus Omnitrophota bacterium]